MRLFSLHRGFFYEHSNISVCFSRTLLVIVLHYVYLEPNFVDMSMKAISIEISM